MSGWFSSKKDDILFISYNVITYEIYPSIAQI